MKKPDKVLDLGSIILFAIPLFTIIMVLYPLAWLLEGMFIGPKGPTLQYLWEPLTDPTIYPYLANTIVLGVTSTAVSILLAIPLAILTVRTDMPHRTFVSDCVILGFLLPDFLYAIAYLILLGPKQGLINRVFMFLLNIDRGFDIFTMQGLVFVTTFGTVPFVYLAVSPTLGRLDRALEDAARIHGGSTIGALLRVSLPLVAPSIGVGALVSFTHAISIYGAPSILTINVATTKIREVLSYPPRFELSSAISFYLIIISSVCAVLYTYWTRIQERYASLSSGWIPPEIIHLGKWKGVAFLAACMVYIFFSILAPFGMLGYTSFTKFWGGALTGFSWQNLTLSNYARILTDAFVMRGVRNSILLAFETATIGTAFGAVLAWISVRLPRRPHIVLLDQIVNLPLGIPSIALGVGLILAYIRPPLVLYATSWILLISYLTKLLPNATRSLAGPIGQIHESLEDASRITGGSWSHTFMRITMPLVKTGLLATWITLFVPSLRELGSSIILVSPGNETLSYVLMITYESVSLEMTACLATITFLVVLAAFIILRRFMHASLVPITTA